MPTYEYACRHCGEHYEVFQSFSEDPLTKCPHCKKNGLKKVFSPVGIVLKGSGFYKTDSRSGSKSASSPAAETKSETKTESKPTETKKSETKAAEKSA